MCPTSISYCLLSLSDRTDWPTTSETDLLWLLEMVLFNKTKIRNTNLTLRYYNHAYGTIIIFAVHTVL